MESTAQTTAATYRAPARGAAYSGERISSLAFDWTMAALGGLFVGGLYVDGWAHNHLPHIETFFTPWHAIFYGSFALLALVFGLYVAFGLAANVKDRSNPLARWARAIPRGYEWSALGVALFLLSGVGDMFWHMRFGIEVDTEALLSPTHLGLATGMALTLLGPFRAAVAAGDERRGALLWPAVLSLTWLYCGLTFMTQFAPAMAHWGIGTPSSGDLAEVRLDRSVTVQLLDAALLSGVVLVLLRQFAGRLPFGSITAVLVINSLLMETQQGGNDQLLGIVVAGLLSDALVAWLQPSAARVTALRWTAFAVPFLYFAAHYATYFVRGYPVYYKVHIWAGLPLIAGLVGWLMSFLALPAPATPRGATADTRA
ncbi:MAG: hypothetical protein JO219_03255 [Candidatus Eremiobacteraeota bacterium]|nr:hypothetical protein [Candidatus Eremiobacteraeota bacterium]MBV8365755.1 hypothetical protein [Candidatus Eremiobacteraeota bacterium]